MLFVFAFIVFLVWAKSNWPPSSRAKKKFESAKLPEQTECSGDFFAEFPEINLTFKLKGLFGEIDFLFDFYKAEDCKNAAKQKKGRPEIPPLARAVFFFWKKQGFQKKATFQGFQAGFLSLLQKAKS
ncbi:MAG: hypothetical protein QXK06_04085 [Candidatus Diapherotrites archaeon]